MPVRLHDVRQLSAEVMASAELSVETRPRGFVEITPEVQRFIQEIAAEDGILLAYLRHTSASLVIQENADPDVRSDLTAALDRLAPENAGWIHDSEGPDDMPSHVKAMLTGVSLHVPVIAGSLGLGTWQGIFVAEHRGRPHAREVLLQFVGTRKSSKL
jgi:secondary thiamine-phosphate synthase enzyme